MRSKITYFILGLMIIGLSCENQSYIPEAEELVVLEGYLFENEPVSQVYLGKTLGFMSEDTVFPIITDAEVFLYWNENEYMLTHYGNGFYEYTGDDLQILEENSYTIKVIYDQEEISAETVVPEKPTGLSTSVSEIHLDPDMTLWEMRENGIGDIELTWDNPDNDYFYVVVENIEEDPEDIELGFTPPGGRMNFRFLSQPFQTDTYILRIFLSIQQYGRHVVRVYRVNQEYVDLYERREQDSRSLSEPLTNVENGLGIFTAFSYDEVMINVVKQ